MSTTNPADRAKRGLSFDEPGSFAAQFGYAEDAPAPTPEAVAAPAQELPPKPEPLNEPGSFVQRFGYADPEPEEAPAPAPIEDDSWSQIPGKTLDQLAATMGSKVSGAARAIADRATSQIKMFDARLAVLPEAVKESKANGTPLYMNPKVIEASKQLGVAPMDFTAVEPSNYEGLEDTNRLKALYDDEHKQYVIATRASAAADKLHARVNAFAEQGQINAGDWSPKSLLPKVVSSVPDMALAAGATAVAGPAAGVGTLMGSSAIGQYDQAREKYNPSDATEYSMVMGALEGVTELPFLEVIRKTPVGEAIVKKIAQKYAANVLAKTGTAMTVEGASEAVNSLLGDLYRSKRWDEDVTLGDAVHNAAQSFAVGSLAAAPLAVAHMHGHTPEQQTSTPEEAPSEAPNAVDAVEAAREQAKAAAAQEGGDALTQELAASHASVEATATHVAAAAQTAEEDALMQNMELDAAKAQEEIAKQEQVAQEEARYAHGQEVAVDDIALPEAPPATPEGSFALRRQQEAAAKDAAFETREKQQETIKEKQSTEARGQLELQKGEEAEAAAAPLGTLADVMPREVKNLAARREAEVAVKPEEPTIVAPPASPDAPKRYSNLGAKREAAAVNALAHEAATSPTNDLPEPTEKQQEAGNYKKGHIKVQGLDISVENPIGSTRSGTSSDGKAWSTKVQDHYGYIKGTEGADGSHVDAFIGPNTDSPNVYVVDQINQGNGAFDEHKVMVGYPNQLAAVRAYKRNFSPGWKVGPVSEMSMQDFKAWKSTGQMDKPLKPIAPVKYATSSDLKLIAEKGKNHPEKIRYRIPESVTTTVEGAPTHDSAFFGHEAKSLEGTQSVVLRDENQAEIGRAVLKERGSSVQILRSELSPGVRGQRLGQRIIEQALDVASKAGKPLTSDSEVSLSQLRAYEALRKKGYTVTYADPKAVEQALATNESVVRGPGPVVTSVEAPKAKTLTKAEAESAIGELKGIKTQVHESIDTLTPEAKAVYDRAPNPNTKGFYDIANKEAHVIASAHTTAADIQSTALHEVVGHHGVHELLGEELPAIMDDVYANADVAAMKAVAKTYDLDVSQLADRRIAAEEYIAQLAGNPAQAPSLWQRVVDQFRRALRKVGLVRRWSENDIRELLRRSYTQATKGNVAEYATADSRIRHALGTSGVKSVKQAPESAAARGAKMVAVLSAKPTGKYSPARLQRARDNVAIAGEKGISHFLATIPRRYLPDFISGGKTSAANDYVHTANKMDGYRNTLLKQAEPKADRLHKYISKNQAAGKLLGQVVHASTLAGIDPSEPYSALNQGKPQTLKDRREEVERRAMYQALKPFWDKLGAEGQAIYREMRDTYVKQREEVIQARKDRINDSAAPDSAKKSLLAMMQEQFESGKTQGPYFPLARFGEYWAAVKSPDGQVISASRFDSRPQMDAYIAAFMADGYTREQISSGRNMDQQQTARDIDPEFAAKVTDLVKGFDPSIADSIWQMYMESLPEMSMRKFDMHRKGRLGFSEDLSRVYGYTLFHGAHQLAKLKYSHRLQGHLQQMEKQVRTMEDKGDPEAKWARPLMSEMQQRHDWAMNPNSSPITAALTSAGFMFHLAMSPASALLNMSQTAVVGLPTLGADYGYAKASGALIKASAEVAGARLMSFGKKDVTSQLTGEEHRAMQEADDQGVFGRTQAHALAEASNESGFDIGSKRKQAMEIASWMFHKAEEFNRKATFLASFRLAKEHQGAAYDYATAFDKAEQLTQDTHFDQSNANRPRVLQGNTAKVVLLFKNYAVNMTYRLSRDFNDSIQGATPEIKKTARSRFVGMMGMTALFSGATGLGLPWLAYQAIMNMVFGDDDKAYDAEADTYKYLTDLMGSKGAEAVMKGPVGALAGVSISNRVGLTNMWFQDPPDNVEGGVWADKFATGMLGALYGIGRSYAEAGRNAAHGNLDKALENMLPKVFSDLAKTHRYATKGMEDNKGSPIIAKDKITNLDLLRQAMGFVPSDIALNNLQNQIKKAAEQKILNRRQLLMDRLFLATTHDGDVKGASEDIRHFNIQNPQKPISADNVMSSAKARQRFRNLSVEGSTLDPDMAYLHQKYKLTP